MTSTIIAPYRFYLYFRKFSKRTWPALYLFSYAIITFYRSCNQPFRSGHSTETALIRLTDQILKNMDNDEVTGSGFYRFPKSF